MIDVRRLLGYSWPVRVALGALFLYSAAPKLRDLAGTVQSVQGYNVLPDPLAQAFGYALPFAELTVGLLLVLGLFTRLAAAGGLALLASFVVAIGLNLARGSAPECGCFSTEGGATIDWTTLARDVVLLGAMTLPLLDPERRLSLDRWIAGSAQPPADEAVPLADGAGDRPEPV